MDNFLKKSVKWQYENEIRLFNKPGIKSGRECGINLKGILYTSRFAGDEETLASINDNLYNNQLIIEKIYPSYSSHYFNMENHKGKTIDFLKNRFINI